MAKKLIKRVRQLQERIEELQRLEGLPGDQVEPWAEMFASLDGGEITEDHLETARTFVTYCLSQGKQPSWVYLREWADSFDEDEIE